MTAKQIVDESIKLSTHERIQLVEDIWDSIAETKVQVKFSPDEV